MLDAFEAEFATYTGFCHVLATGSGTAALHLALRVLGVDADDEVIVPSFTFIGSVTPVLFQRARPIFIDSDQATWLLDPNVLEDTLSKRARQGRSVKAVVGVDLYGQPCDPDLYRPICERYGAEFVIDAAESVGSLLRGVAAGRGARLAAYSFNGNKIMTTSGGGALGSDENGLIARARNLSQQARVPVAHYEHEEYGYNYRLSNVLAAIGRAQLETMEARVEQRRTLFEQYQRRLGVFEGISFMPEIPDARCNRWLTAIVFDPSLNVRPEDVRLALEANNIESRALWKPMHLQPVFRTAEMVGGRVSESLFQTGLCLPSGPHVNDDVMNTIVSVIDQVISRHAHVQASA
jgi:dTDP-4-amino-4,6-dideoxygalactose transaminase